MRPKDSRLWLLPPPSQVYLLHGMFTTLTKILFQDEDSALSPEELEVLYRLCKLYFLSLFLILYGKGIEETLAVDIHVELMFVHFLL